MSTNNSGNSTQATAPSLHNSGRNQNQPGSQNGPVLNENGNGGGNVDSPAEPRSVNLSNNVCAPVPGSNSGPLTAADIQLDVLPFIYDFIKSIERESSEASASVNSASASSNGVSGSVPGSGSAATAVGQPTSGPGAPTAPGSKQQQPRGTSGGPGEFQDTSSVKVIEFQKRLDIAREQISRLPGIDLSKEDQLRRLEALRKQVILKKNLIQKYKHLGALTSIHQFLVVGSCSGSPSGGSSNGNGHMSAQGSNSSGFSLGSMLNSTGSGNMPSM